MSRLDRVSPYQPIALQRIIRAAYANNRPRRRRTPAQGTERFGESPGLTRTLTQASLGSFPAKLASQCFLAVSNSLG